MGAVVTQGRRGLWDKGWESVEVLPFPTHGGTRKRCGKEASGAPILRRAPRKQGSEPRAHLVVESHVHHSHFSNHLDPAGATGVVRVDASAEPHLGKSEINASLECH